MTNMLLLNLLLALQAASPSPVKTVEKNGMTITWTHQGERIDFEVFAPTQGWVAVGFNTCDRLPGTNLIMGKVENGTVTISDRYIVAVGEHQPVEKIGGRTHLSNLDGKENGLGTTIRFSIAVEALDALHHNLLENSTFTLLIAYSQADDFAHHSRMRTSVQITI